MYEKRVSEFQFHYGTIKRIPFVANTFLVKIFQFHYGTIKSLIRKSEKMALRYFNSTMVRLKGLRLKRSCSRTCISIPLWYD